MVIYIATQMTRQAPHSSIDLYSDAVLTDPYPTYKQLRDMASAVYLEKVDAYYLGRYRLSSPACGSGRSPLY